MSDHCNKRVPDHDCSSSPRGVRRGRNAGHRKPLEITRERGSRDRPFQNLSFVPNTFLRWELTRRASGKQDSSTDIG